MAAMQAGVIRAEIDNVESCAGLRVFPPPGLLAIWHCHAPNVGLCTSPGLSKRLDADGYFISHLPVTRCYNSLRVDIARQCYADRLKT